MSTSRYDRAALVLGVAALAGSLLALVRGTTELDFVTVRGGGIAVLLMVGGCATLAGLIGLRMLMLAAGAGFMVAAVVQLLQAGRSTNWLGGDGSTFAFMSALGIGLLVLATAPRSETSRREGTSRDGPEHPS